MNKKKKDKPVVYNMYPQDDEIDDSINHLNQMEKKYGKWNLPKEDEDIRSLYATYVQTGSEPICTSLGCETRHSNPDDKKDPPVEYNFNKPLD